MDPNEHADDGKDDPNKIPDLKKVKKKKRVVTERQRMALQKARTAKKKKRDQSTQELKSEVQALKDLLLKQKQNVSVELSRQGVHVPKDAPKYGYVDDGRRDEQLPLTPLVGNATMHKALATNSPHDVVDHVHNDRLTHAGQRAPLPPVDVPFTPPKVMPQVSRPLRMDPHSPAFAPSVASDVVDPQWIGHREKPRQAYTQSPVRF